MGKHVKNASFENIRDAAYLAYRGVPKKKICEVLKVGDVSLTRWAELPIYQFLMAMLMFDGLSIDGVRQRLDSIAGIDADIPF